MWIVCITSVRHVLTVNGYGGRQTKENEKSWCFKGWETLVIDKYEFSPLNKMERAITGEMIKETCIPIQTDRLGNIITPISL